MLKDYFEVPNKPAIKSGNILSCDFTDHETFIPQPLDYTRGTLATYVDCNGLIKMSGISDTELVTNGDFATDSDWTKGTGVTILNGKANWNNTGNNVGVTQNGIFTIGKTYKVEFTVSNYVGGTVRVRAPFTGTRIRANGTYTFYGAATTDFLYLQGETQFGNPQFSIDNVSVKEVDVETPRIDYTTEIGKAKELQKPSLLLEPQSTNLIEYSEDYSQSSWNKLNAQVSRTVETSPDGNNTNVFNLTGTNGNLYVGGTTGVEYTISVYIKSNNKNKDKFKLRLGNNISSEYEATDEWKRYVFTSTPTTGVLGITTSSSPDNEFDLLVWGFQLEQLSYATSYIPTSGSTVTRNQDLANNAGSAPVFNSEEGVLYAEVAALANDLEYEILSVSDGSTNNRAYLQYTNVSNQIKFVYKVGGATQAGIGTATFDIVDFHKIACKWKANDFALWIDGDEVGTDTNGSVNSAGTFTQLNFDDGAGNTDFYGKVKEVKVFRRALTDSELQELTNNIV